MGSGITDGMINVVERASRVEIGRFSVLEVLSSGRGLPSERPGAHHISGSKTSCAPLAPCGPAIARPNSVVGGDAHETTPTHRFS